MMQSSPCFLPTIWCPVITPASDKSAWNGQSPCISYCEKVKTGIPTCQTRGQVCPSSGTGAFQGGGYPPQAGHSSSFWAKIWSVTKPGTHYAAKWIPFLRRVVYAHALIRMADWSRPIFSECLPRAIIEWDTFLLSLVEGLHIRITRHRNACLLKWTSLTFFVCNIAGRRPSPSTGGLPTCTHPMGY